MEASVAGAAERIVPRTAAAGKASSTRIEMSRTIDGIARQRPARADRRGAASAPRTTRSISAAYTSSFSGNPRAETTAGDELTEDGEQLPAVRTDGPHLGRTSVLQDIPRDVGVNSTETAKAAPISSTTPFTSKKSTALLGADQCG